MFKNVNHPHRNT